MGVVFLKPIPQCCMSEDPGCSVTVGCSIDFPNNLWPAVKYETYRASIRPHQIVVFYRYVKETLFVIGFVQLQRKDWLIGRHVL